MSRILGRCEHDERTTLLALAFDDYKELVPEYGIVEKLFQYYVNNQSQVYIAGGAARWMLSPNKVTALPEDIDIWVPYYISSDWIYKFKQQIFPVEFRDKIQVIQSSPPKAGVSERVFTFICQPYHLNIQIMTGCAAIEEILSSFDFSVCRAAITSNRSWPHVSGQIAYRAIVDEKFMEDETNRRIRICTEVDKSLIWRIYKYYKKGYRLEVEDAAALIGLFPEMGLKEQELTHAMTRGFRMEESLIGPILSKLYEKYLERVNSAELQETPFQVPDVLF